MTGSSAVLRDDFKKVTLKMKIIVKPTIKNVARLGNLASKVGFVFLRVPTYFRALL